MTSRHSVTLADARLACDILRRNGVLFLHFTGGEPLVHRDFTAMVAHATQIGMIPTLVTKWRVADAGAGRRIGGSRDRYGVYFN